jgi:hypothetical protein
MAELPEFAEEAEAAEEFSLFKDISTVVRWVVRVGFHLLADTFLIIVWEYLSLVLDWVADYVRFHGGHHDLCAHILENVASWYILGIAILYIVSDSFIQVQHIWRMIRPGTAGTGGGNDTELRKNVPDDSDR